MNKETTIEEKLAVVAEFMGEKTYNMKTAFYDNEMPHVMSKGHSGYMPVAYHTSYDWIMPVWRKFRDLPLETHSQDTPESFWEPTKYGEYFEMIKSALVASDTPEDCFNILYEAIAWLNSLNQNTTHE